MLLKKIKKFWNSGLMKIKENRVVKVGGILLLLVLVGLSICILGLSQREDKEDNSQKESAYPKENIINNIYQSAYQELIKKNIKFDEIKENDIEDNLVAVKKIVDYFGNEGYAAVDQDNQVNMVCSDKVDIFCNKVSEKKKASLTIISVCDKDEIIQYNLKTDKGKVTVNRVYSRYEKGKAKEIKTGKYTAQSWKYTKEGYLLFEGHWFVEEYYLYAFSDLSEHVSLRVKPLDEKCRLYNRKYIMPVGYERNNMFIIDWDEKNFGKLDFYDLYDKWGIVDNEKHLFYTGVQEQKYKIPEAEFEKVIKSYLKIDSEILRKKTVYLSKDRSYQYRVRGLYDCEGPDFPYPEVINYTENKDGTIKLIVNVVFPNENLSKVYAHEVIVRPLKNGKFQYVSNHIISSKDNHKASWRVERLSEKQWKLLFED